MESPASCDIAHAGKKFPKGAGGASIDAQHSPADALRKPWAFRADHRSKLHLLAARSMVVP